MNTGARPEPEDGVHTTASFLLFRGWDAIGASFFLGALPWWQPAAWFAAVFCTGSLRFVVANMAWFHAWPAARRRVAYRLFTCLHSAAIGSAALFVYVPGNLQMQAVLGLYLFGAAAITALRVPADPLRCAVALAFVVGPTAARMTFEGAGEAGAPRLLLGLGGLFMIGMILLASRSREQILAQQMEQRRIAEVAADAMAAVGLSKSRFFAAVSHDLRQPVHAIGLYLDPIARYARQDTAGADLPRAVEGIRLSWKALDGLLAQVLDLTRLDAGAMRARMQAVDLGTLVGGIVMQHAASAERAGVRLVALGGEDCVAMADELMLRRVASNLIDNAVKFSSRGGTVAVAVRPRREGWCLQVRDAGRGIEPAAHEHIFEEFVQVDNEARDRTQGYGLGLAISRRFARLMDGDLTVRSAPGRGTCMSVWLRRAAPFAEPEEFGALSLLLSPDVPGEPEPGAREVAAALGGPQQSARDAAALPPLDILLVEDDLLVATAMTRLLQAWGQRVVHADSAARALEHAGFGEVAICDVRLPKGQSGIEVALRLREMGKKVLLVTGETDAGVRRTAEDHGLPLLIKPVPIARLLSTLHEMYRGSPA